MDSVSEAALKRRAAVERWKVNNREYYLKQKRELSGRPEYRAKMRARYAAERAELKEAGILPRKMGRPLLAAESTRGLGLALLALQQHDDALSVMLDAYQLYKQLHPDNGVSPIMVRAEIVRTTFFFAAAAAAASL